MDVKDILEERIEELCDERKSFVPGSKEKIQHDENLVGMFDAYNSMVKIEVEDRNAQREIEQKENEAKKKTMVEWVKAGLYGLGTVAGIGLAMLARNDEREGFITDDKITFFDKFRKDKP